MKKMVVSIIIISMVFCSNFCFAGDTFKIGVLAKNGPVKALKMWKATGDYLTSKLDGTFEIVPLGFDAVNPAIEKGAVDFFLVNSSMFITAKVKYGASEIATMINSRQGKPLKSFGGVILTSEENEDINSVSDLKGKTFMAVKKSSFGGWQMAYMELLNQSIDPFKDFSSLEFGGKHDNVVLAIQNGAVDAGTVRTDTLERMVATGMIDLEEFKSLPDQGKFRKSQGLSSEINIVMFVGRLNPIKGLEFLIRSFAKFASNSPNSKLYIVGEDEGTGYRASLVDIAKGCQLEDLVVFPGFLTGYDKLSAIMDASVLVQCSQQEQGPRVPFEAVLLGTPVIVTKHTGSGEMVTQFDAGQVVEYNNTEQLSQSLQNVIDNLEYAKNRTNKAAIKIKKSMSLEKVVSQYQELYLAANKSVS